MERLSKDIHTSYVLFFALLVKFSGCSPGTHVCGGNVYPDKLDSASRAIVKETSIRSKEFCSEASATCEFTVAKTNQGWSVVARRTILVDGKCVVRIGDDIIYVYDNSGAIISVVGGI